MRGLKRWGNNEDTDRQGVASFTDAWIETATNQRRTRQEKSHLLQMRGLKQGYYVTMRYLWRRIFYRCVD